MIKIVFFIIIILFTLLLLKKYKEQFNSDIIYFLEKSSVCNKLKNINYNYNALDIKLRDIPSHYHSNIYKFYCENLLEFNNLEKNLINWVVTGMRDRIPKHLQFIINNLKFAKFQNNIENGYPHTNYDIIFFTESYINKILYYYNNNEIEQAIKNIGAVIIHEAVHVWQRKDPKGFLDLYTNYWNFEKVSKIYNGDYLDKLKRYNPDGVDTNWIFKLKKKNIYILSVYSSDATNIGDVDFIGIYLEKNGDKCIIPDSAKHNPLSTVKEFNGFFKHLHGNHYHPNEISAEMMSIYYLKVMNLSHKKFENIGYNNMLVWFEKYLKN
jgi:hypothetical protein